MFHKLICTTFITLTLAACAPTTPPTSSANKTSTPTTITSNNKTVSLVGKWHCQSEFEGSIHYAFDVEYQADGTSRDKGIFTVKLDKNVKDLAWQFEAQTQNKWRIDGTQYIEQQTAKPIVRLLPVENPTARALLSAFEKSNPDAAEFKTEMLESLSRFDNEPVKAKIITLSQTTFKTEADVDDMKVVRVCQRR